MTKLLSRISHLDELHPLRITNSLDYIEGYPKGLFIDHRTLLVLNKLHQYEQLPPHNKGKPNPTRT